MEPTSRQVVRTYLLLMLLTTLSNSLIWGVNTLFLLDAGLSITQAFAANAFFTAGQVIFEIPTGVFADTVGRRFSYMLGTVTLAVSTALYFVLWQQSAPFWMWAIVSAALGLGYTFFSGATEAWLVDALNGTKYKGSLDKVFAKGQVVSGIAMFVGSVGGGLLAQVTDLGVPYIVRSCLLLTAFAAAWLLMKDIGFKPQRNHARYAGEVKKIMTDSIDHGLRKPAVRWIMLTSPFIFGVVFFGFYAMQPYLLELYGKETAYTVAGLAAAIVAGAQIAGGLLAPQIRKMFKLRTSHMMASISVAAGSLLLTGLFGNFALVLVLLILWGAAFAALMPIRQAYLNELIPSAQRATVLSTDNLLGSAGGVITQPALGRVADIHGYAASYVVSGVIQAMALPFVYLARREKSAADLIKSEI